MKTMIIGIYVLCTVARAQLPAAQRTMTPPGVTVNPAQPYRPIPTNQVQPRESIFEFYLRALNPRKINWGAEIDRRLTILTEQSVGNPYFRVAAIQTGLILFLLLLCWVWWDKMRQIKCVAAEFLADAINAKRLADRRALDAVETHNRHIQTCNRVIEEQQSGVGKVNQVGENTVNLQNELAAAKSEVTRLNAQLKERDNIHAKLAERLQVLESRIERSLSENPNAELLARLERAEAQLSAQRPRRG
jgi:hypothetical protein